MRRARGRRPPGEFFDVGGHRLHLHCAGRGAPAVVFDAALGASALSWTLVQPEVARVTRACTYDRAGLGWSEAGPLPRTAGRIAGELRQLLHAAGVGPPYVLVGHSFGALVVRIFAARHRAETAGLVLVDPAHPEEWLDPSEDDRRNLDRGVRLCRYGASAARLRVAHVVAALARLGARRPARAIVAAITRGSFDRADENILAPVLKLPMDARRVLTRFWTRPEFFEALGSQIGAVCESASEVRDAERGGPDDLPLTTISATTSSARRLALQEALARSSSRGRHVVAHHSGHWIPLDEPALVVEEILRIVGRRS